MRVQARPLRTIQMVVGCLLVIGAVAALLGGVNVAYEYLAPAMGPLAWPFALVLALCGLMVAAPVITSGVVLIHPPLAERRGPSRFDHAILPSLHRDPRMSSSAPTRPPRLADRYGYGQGALLALVLTTVVATVGGIWLFPRGL